MRVDDSMRFLAHLQAAGNVRGGIIRWYEQEPFERRKRLSHMGAIRINEMPFPYRQRLRRYHCAEAPWEDYADPGNDLYGRAFSILMGRDSDLPGWMQGLNSESKGDLFESALATCWVLLEYDQQYLHEQARAGDSSGERILIDARKTVEMAVRDAMLRWW